MKNPIRYALFLIILIGNITLCLAQTNKSADEPPPRPDGEFNPTSWKEYSSAEGRFSILFPGIPKEGLQSVDVQGGQFKVHIHNLKAYAEYGVIYADYPIPVGDPHVAKQVLDNGAKGGAAEVKAEVLSMTEISIDGYPGRLLRERLPNGSILKAKMYLVGQRLYQIAVTMPKAETSPDRGKAFEKFADKFLDSFTLKNETSASSIDSQIFTSVEGGFTIALPQKPTKQLSQPIAAGNGSLQFHILNWATALGEYTVGYMDMPRLLEDPKISKSILDNARDSGIKKENGKLLGERDLNLDGHVGREFKIEASDGIFIDRVYLVKQRFYSISVFVRTAKLAEEAAASKILDSFKLIGKKETVVK